MIWTFIVDRLIAPFKKWLVVAGAILSVLGYAWLKGRAAGKAAEREKVEKATKKIEGQWNEVDRSDPDLDAALDGLRHRSGRH